MCACKFANSIDYAVEVVVRACYVAYFAVHVYKYLAPKEVASKFLWSMEPPPPPPPSRSVSNLAQRLRSIPYFNIYYFFGIRMHYTAFSAVLFLRVVLYGPQDLVSFKTFPCTDGLGSTETVSDQPYCNTSDSM